MPLVGDTSLSAAMKKLAETQEYIEKGTKPGGGGQPQSFDPNSGKYGGGGGAKKKMRSRAAKKAGTSRSPRGNSTAAGGSASSEPRGRSAAAKKATTPRERGRGKPQLPAGTDPKNLKVQEFQTDDGPRFEVVDRTNGKRVATYSGGEMESNLWSTKREAQSVFDAASKMTPTKAPAKKKRPNATKAARAARQRQWDARYD